MADKPTNTAGLAPDVSTTTENTLILDPINANTITGLRDTDILVWQKAIEDIEDMVSVRRTYMCGYLAVEGMFEGNDSICIFRKHLKRVQTEFPALLAFQQRMLIKYPKPNGDAANSSDSDRRIHSRFDQFFKNCLHLNNFSHGWRVFMSGQLRSLTRFRLHMFWMESMKYDEHHRPQNSFGVVAPGVTTIRPTDRWTYRKDFDEGSRDNVHPARYFDDSYAVCAEYPVHLFKYLPRTDKLFHLDITMFQYPVILLCQKFKLVEPKINEKGELTDLALKTGVSCEPDLKTADSGMWEVAANMDDFKNVFNILWIESNIDDLPKHQLILRLDYYYAEVPKIYERYHEEQ
jgi:hypothetical protein